MLFVVCCVLFVVCRVLCVSSRGLLLRVGCLLLVGDGQKHDCAVFVFVFVRVWLGVVLWCVK